MKSTAPVGVTRSVSTFQDRHLKAVTDLRAIKLAWNTLKIITSSLTQILRQSALHKTVQLRFDNGRPQHRDDSLWKAKACVTFLPDTLNLLEPSVLRIVGGVLFDNRSYMTKVPSITRGSVATSLSQQVKNMSKHAQRMPEEPIHT